MPTRPSRLTRVTAAAVVACASVVAASVHAQKPREPLPAEPLGSGAEAIFPVLEGWGPHKDGSTVILLGYYNRNRQSAFDIPIGPDNRIEPGGPDYGQPTYFEPSQQHGVFAIKVPSTFGTSKLTWTLKVNGQESKVSFWLNPPYWVDFFKNAATGNEPPVVRFAAAGPLLTGPPLGVAQALTATIGQPLPLTLWARDVAGPREGATAELAEIRRKTEPVVDPVAIVGGQTFGGPASRVTPRDRPNMIVIWHRHRGPAPVTFSVARVPLTTKGDSTLFVEAATAATFSAPGEYVLRAEVTDDSGPGGDGDQCCWTTAHVKVTVK